MFILAYLMVGVIVWSMLLAFITPLREHLRQFTLWSLLFVLIGLGLFTLLSASLGVVRFGVPFNLNIPDDYLAFGVAGFLILVVGALGVLSPIIAAWLVLRQFPAARAI